MNEISAELYGRACQHIPGGVNSPVRAFKAVGGTPLYMERGAGAKLYDADGREYVDFCGSWGPLVLGHAHPAVVEAVCATARKGLSFGTCNPLEVELAELLCELVPGAEMVRLVNSGTEAVMTALRLARGHTGRNLIVKFDGCYHGHSDGLLVAAGSGLLTHAMPSSMGVSAAVAGEVISVPYNDIPLLEETFARHGAAIAAAIVEPVAGNMGLVLPSAGFLPALRQLCDRHSACLVFDEVITGFRFHAGPYATLAGVTPDLSVFGKIIGGGMPIGAVAGPAAIMRRLAPLGDVYQAGTLSGNPVACAAGLATLQKLVELNPYPRLANLAASFATEVNACATVKGIDAHCAVHGGVFTVFFTDKGSLRSLHDVLTCDTKRFAVYFHHMQCRGFYMSPSQFELNFVSDAHTPEDMAAAAEATINFLETISSKGI